MIEEIIVHIGPPKTGSTTIQKALFSSAACLLSQGIYVPRQENATCVLNAVEPGRKIQRNDLDEYEALKNVIETDGQIDGRDVGISRVLISCEFLSGLGLEKLSQFSRFLRSDRNKITVVMYLRNPAEMHRAKVQEMLKKGWPYQKTARKIGHRNKVVFEKFDAAFPGQVRPRIFQSKTHGWDVLHDFEQACSIGGLIRETEKKSNVSISLQAAIVLDELSKLSFEARVFRDIAKDVLGISGSAFAIDKGDHTHCLPEFEDDAAWCNQTFGTSFDVTDTSKVDWAAAREEAMIRTDVQAVIDKYAKHATIGEHLL